MAKNRWRTQKKVEYQPKMPITPNTTTPLPPNLKAPPKGVLRLVPRGARFERVASRLRGANGDALSGDWGIQ
jgi:hypothetical protein